MGFKDLFITREEQPSVNTMPDYDDPEPTLDYLEKVSTFESVTPDANFINDVYNKAGLSDLSRSIFKVEEISATLPNTLPEDTLRQSIIGVLSSFNLSVSDLVYDGKSRLDNVETCRSEAEADYNNRISNNNDQIESLKRKISDLEAENLNITESKNMMNSAAYKEEERINKLITFINPSNSKEEV